RVLFRSRAAAPGPRSVHHEIRRRRSPGPRGSSSSRSSNWSEPREIRAGPGTGARSPATVVPMDDTAAWPQQLEDVDRSDDSLRAWVSDRIHRLEDIGRAHV